MFNRIEIFCHYGLAVLGRNPNHCFIITQLHLSFIGENKHRLQAQFEKNFKFPILVAESVRYTQAGINIRAFFRQRYFGCVQFDGFQVVNLFAGWQETRHSLACSNRWLTESNVFAKSRQAKSTVCPSSNKQVARSFCSIRLNKQDRCRLGERDCVSVRNKI